MACVDPATVVCCGSAPAGTAWSTPIPGTAIVRRRLGVASPNPARAPASPNHHSPSPGPAAPFNQASVPSRPHRLAHAADRLRGTAQNPHSLDRTEPSFIAQNPHSFPFYVTGAITASGGSWNASIVAEVANWGETKLTAVGLGSYIAQATEAGDFHRVLLGIAVMCVFVTLFNRLLWRPLYGFAERRLRLG